MKIKISELKKALKFLADNGDTQEIDVSIDENLSRRILINASVFDDPVTITIFDTEMNTFPKITKTERL